MKRFIAEYLRLFACSVLIVLTCIYVKNEVVGREVLETISAGLMGSTRDAARGKVVEYAVTNAKDRDYLSVAEPYLRDLAEFREDLFAVEKFDELWDLVCKRDTTLSHREAFRSGFDVPLQDAGVTGARYQIDFVYGEPAEGGNSTYIRRIPLGSVGKQELDQVSNATDQTCSNSVYASSRENVPKAHSFFATHPGGFERALNALTEGVDVLYEDRKREIDIKLAALKVRQQAIEDEFVDATTGAEVAVAYLFRSLTIVSASGLFLLFLIKTMFRDVNMVRSFKALSEYRALAADENQDVLSFVERMREDDRW